MKYQDKEVKQGLENETAKEKMEHLQSVTEHPQKLCKLLKIKSNW